MNAKAGGKMTEETRGPNQEGDLPSSQLQEIFPEAAAVFSFAMKPLSEMKDKCLVVIDTTALLIPYTTQASTARLEQIKETYSKLIEQQRLLIPGQVAREFARNRGKKLTEMYHQISQATAPVADISPKEMAKAAKADKIPLLESFEHYERTLVIEEELAKHATQSSELVKEFRVLREQILKQIKGWLGDDPVSLIYRALFDEKVVIDPSLDQEILKKDWGRRKDNKIPPGFADKTDGDLRIWHTILYIGETYKKPVLFVTTDEKDNWWDRPQQNMTALYPRHELVDEFRRRSDGQTFHMVKFSDFLDLFGAEKQVVDEIRQEEEISVRLHGPSLGILSLRPYDPLGVVRAVFDWFQRRYPQKGISAHSAAPYEFVLANVGDMNTKVRVVPIDVFHDALGAIYKAEAEAFSSLAVEHCSQLIVVAVLETSQLAQKVLNELSPIGPDIHIGALLLVGYTNARGGFQPLGQILQTEDGMRGSLLLPDDPLLIEPGT
jgi:hypothetical protein